MRKQIFKYFYLSLFFISILSFGLKCSEILEIYNLNNKNLKENKILETEKYLFSIAVSKKNKIQDISYKKNKIKAEAKLLTRIRNQVDWPSNFPFYLKEALWKYYTSGKDFELQGINVLDKGEIGEKYYVVIGTKKNNVDKYKINYSAIVKELK